MGGGVAAPGAGAASVAAWAGAGTLLLMVVTMLRITVGVSPRLLDHSTESHGAILMLGGATLGALPAIADGVPRPAADLLAVAGLAAFAYMMTSTGPFSLVLYETGYLIVLVPAVALVIVSSHPDSRVTQLLGFSPFYGWTPFLRHLPLASTRTEHRSRPDADRTPVGASVGVRPRHARARIV